MIEDHDVCLYVCNRPLHFLDFSAAGEKGRVRPLATAANDNKRGNPGAGGKLPELVHIVSVAGAAEIEAD
jgi:hypothetical protein